MALDCTATETAALDCMATEPEAAEGSGGWRQEAGERREDRRQVSRHGIGSTGSKMLPEVAVAVCGSLSNLQASTLR